MCWSSASPKAVNDGFHVELGCGDSNAYKQVGVAQLAWALS